MWIVNCKLCTSKKGRKWEKLHGGDIKTAFTDNSTKVYVYKLINNNEDGLRAV